MNHTFWGWRIVAPAAAERVLVEPEGIMLPIDVCRMLIFVMSSTLGFYVVHLPMVQIFSINNRTERASIICPNFFSFNLQRQ